MSVEVKSMQIYNSFNELATVNMIPVTPLMDIFNDNSSSGSSVDNVADFAKPIEELTEPAKIKGSMDYDEKADDTDDQSVRQKSGVAGTWKEYADRFAERFERFAQGAKTMEDKHGNPLTRSERPAFNLLLFGNGAENPDAPKQRQAAKKLLDTIAMTNPEASKRIKEIQQAFKINDRLP